MQALPPLLLCLLLLLPTAAARAESAGAKQHREFVEAGQLYDDPELQAYVQRVGARLVAVSDDPDGQFTFSVLDSEVINAFAAPGGYVYVSRGLLPYLESEEQLAGVLGHEIGHVTAGHHSRQGRADITNQIVAATAYIFTGSADLADASSMYGAELISGYGREMELEADSLGAEYMYRAGYDPQAMLDVIGVLKDQEQYQRVKGKTTGKPPGTYHGLYATHPRNDKRLQTVIAKASQLDPDYYAQSPERPGEFRSHLEGLVWGQSIQGERDEHRYYHDRLAFTFEHPEGWSVDTGSAAVVARAPDNSASLTITLRRKDGDSPQQALRNSAVGELAQGRKLQQGGLEGYTAIASNAGVSKRLAVIDYNYRYLFVAAADDFAAADPALAQMIESFRPISARERSAAATPHYIHYIQVPRGATLASLAAGIHIPDAEDQLRLINGMYPRGEPRTGDWIKTIR